MQTSQLSPTPALAPLSLSHLCAIYLRVQFRHKLNARLSGDSTAAPPPPLLLPVPLAVELGKISSKLVDAFVNRQKVGWDVTRYADKLPKKPLQRESSASKTKEASLKQQYVPLDGVVASTPCIIIDAQGIIMAWYLPKILSDSRQNVMLMARQKLRSLLNSSMSATSWRNNPKYFHPGEDSLRGSVNFSPAWFQQAHDEMSQEYPQASVNFRSEDALNWLAAISESNAIVSAILAVIHPDLYDAGWKAIKHLMKKPEICPQNVLSQWASAFSGVSVISNRMTLPHRDTSSRFNWYDILVTLGSYETCDLELPGLGISLEYGPGTVVGLSGMVLEHAVPMVEGDRVCYAYFMRDNVHEWARVPCKNWMDIWKYKEHRM